VITKLSVDKLRIKNALAVAEGGSDVQRVLQIRQLAARSSTAKLTSFLERVSADGRVRENLMFHGAGTGRWSGKGVQLQNLTRGSLPYVEVLAVIDCLGARDLDWLRLYGDPVDVVTSIIRWPDHG
jgi:DNA polymerase